MYTDYVVVALAVYDDDFESYIVKTAPQMYQTDSANAMIKASVEYRTFAGYEASSSKFQSSFEDLRNAGMKGITFEQAKNDIRLSGDVGQIGERAARIAINDGLSQNHKKAKPVTGTVRIAEDVKKTSAIKENMPILKHIARSGDVAIVIEHFSGADRESKGFYTRGVIHLNADKLSEGGYTYTGIHECVHYVAEVNAEGYKAIEKFVENYYKKKGVDIEAKKKATQALYEQRGVKLTPEEAMEEIVCNTLSDIATDADALTAFMGLDSKSRNKFIDALKTLAGKLKAWAKTHLAGTKYHDVVIKDADTLLSLAKQLNAELAKSSQKNNTAEGSGVKYKLNEYSAHQVKNWSNSKKIVVYENESQLSSFIDDALKGTNLGKKLYFGMVSEDLANRIFNDTGVDVKNYNVVLRASEVRKILLYSHGDPQKEELRGQRAIIKDDLMVIPRIITTPDNIELAGYTDDNKPAISFQKTINGKTTVISYVSDKHMDLSVQTMHSGKEKKPTHYSRCKILCFYVRDE